MKPISNYCQRGEHPSGYLVRDNVLTVIFFNKKTCKFREMKIGKLKENYSDPKIYEWVMGHKRFKNGEDKQKNIEL
jgi:succinate dehydrogenase flavin-adding protein (antitoxin of CptAB toxin-antitoxin module)